VRRHKNRGHFIPFSICIHATLVALLLGAQGDVKAQSDNKSSLQDDTALEEILITARRREENMQDSPVAVSAFAAAALERRQIADTTDLDRVTPSLQFATNAQLSGNNSAAVVFIRGVGQLDPTPAVDPGVGIYIDEVYMGRSLGGAMTFWDIANVQVLRGPQGTLFGRNTIGGAVLINTREPGPDLGGNVRLRVGEDNLIEAYGAVNLPFNETLSARLSLGTRQRDGYVERTFDGLDLGDDNSYSFNGSLKWEPSEDFGVIFRSDFTNEDENGAPFVFAGINESAAVPAIVSVAAGCPGATIPFAPLVPGDPAFGAPNVPEIDDPRCANDFYDEGEFTNGGNAPVESTLDAWGLSATANWQLNGNTILKSITALRNTEWTGIRDADNTPFTIITTDIDSESEQFTQELQVQVNVDQLSGVTGLFYFNETTDDRLTVPLAFPPTPDVIASILSGGPGSRDLQIVDLDTESIAVFTEWNIYLNEALSLSAGLRYTEDTKQFRGTVLNLFPATEPDPDPLPTLATSEGGPLFIFDDTFEDTYTAVTGSAGLQYRWNEDVMAYLSFAQSFKSGGFNTRYNAPTADNLPVSFDEETVETWEAGIKADLTTNFRLNVAAFTSAYDDIQLIYRQGVVPLLFNAGSATIDGFELEFTYLPYHSLLVEGGISYLDDSIDDVTDIPDADTSITPDNDLPLTPEVQANLGLEYQFSLSRDYGLTPRLDVSYTDSQFFDATNTALVAQNDAVTLVTGSLVLDNIPGDWTVTLGVDNLTDELYPIQGNASLGTLGYAEIIYARPRSWFASFSADF